MGLDAVVFCDCVERKRLKVPHPYPRLLYISSNGSPDIRSTDPDQLEEHDKWMELPPCKHQSMMVNGCYLGDAGFIEHVSSILEVVLKPPLPRCPILLGRVLYCGSHTGDHLTISQVQKLAVELQKLKRLNLKKVGVSSRDLRWVRSVMAKLDSLVSTSRRIKKPIAF
jgi:hypothetical protein